MPQEDLSLGEAIEQYLASLDLEPRTVDHYRGTLGELLRAYPNSRLSDFEPPEGTTRTRSVLEQQWGNLAPRTFNKRLSPFRRFFAWHTERGSLRNDPTNGLTRKEFESESRVVVTDEEREKIFAANPAPWDAVPLRLVFLLGIETATLLRLRFGDLDPRTQEVSLTLRGGRTHRITLDDPAFWTAFAELRRLRSAEDAHYVFPRENTRIHIPSDAELKAMDVDGVLDHGRRYLRMRHNGRWERTTIDPSKPRNQVGAFKWWYRCLWRAEIVPPDVMVGYPMTIVRDTLGQSLYAKGGMPEVRRVLGIVSRSSTHSDVYTNRDADQLDVTLRRVRQQYRPIPRGATDAWWKLPIKRLADYIEEERDLVELSRVSIDVLRTQKADSVTLRDAGRALIRVVQPAQLIEQARKESADDHPQLHGHSLVTIWGAMETMTIDVVAAWLENWPAARQDPAVADIKISLAAYESMSPTERIDYLVQELDQKRSGAKGIARFERLLDAVGLSGSHHAQLAKNIYEMQQIRNVFAHKSGVADGRFVEACPYLGYRVGQRIVIDRHAWSDFLVNALLYAELVLQRAKSQLGVAIKASAPTARPIRYVAP